ncbi:MULTISPECIES: hypothetical protein [unclassified Spirosoma]|uniref:hypothetical protein n=1 Tax=unclassified Spirosoma TaxID=2621999 RepID=UPI0009636921|nr:MULTISPECIES: hypothetical protein [unclassified Spirosoma]MBN8825095.1 hypothetical protein [Spirosoma sp.]OJW77212.1 MAG: hypothetical protein BGO59_31660 [Spirosoma sp. 48-14]
MNDQLSTLPPPADRSARYLIGIDPDKDANGVAVWDRRERKLMRLELMRTPDLIDYCRLYRQMAFVHLEAGHNINFIWGLDPKWSQQKTASVGRDKGVNHGVGYTIIQFFEYYQIGFVQIEPRRKKDEVKFTADLLKQITGWETKNKELIAAAKLVVGL